MYLGDLPNGWLKCMDVVNVSILPVNCLFGSSIETYCNRGVLSLKYTEA